MIELSEEGRVDLYVTLVLSGDEHSNVVRETIEYAVNIVRERHGLRVVYRELAARDREFPILIINELEPIVIDEAIPLERLLKLLLASLRVDLNEFSDHKSSSESATLANYF